MSEDGIENTTPPRIRRQTPGYNLTSGKNYVQNQKKFCKAVKYLSNVVSKVQSSVKKRKGLSKLLCNFMRTREMVHNIFAQVEGKEQTLVYGEQEARVLANFITSCIGPSAQNYSQMH